MSDRPNNRIKFEFTDQHRSLLDRLSQENTLNNPPHQPQDNEGQGKSLAISVTAHLALVAFFTLGLSWNTSKPQAVEAMLVRDIGTREVPDEPVQPKKALVMAVALLLGLMLGAATVLVRRSLRNAVESAEDIETATGLSVYATVPQSPGQVGIDKALQNNQSAQLLARSQSEDFAVEALRGFMTALQFARVGAANNVVLITGATPGVGKSFVSANFAAVLANSGQRVLLIDGDLRKGYLHQYFDTARERGLSEVLAGATPLASALRPSALPGLDFVPTGSLPPNPAELLRGAAMAQLLQQASAQYDLVLIDTAGMAQRDARTRELLDMLAHRSIQRLVVLNALDAREQGAVVRTRTRCAGCPRDGRRARPAAAGRPPGRPGAGRRPAVAVRRGGGPGRDGPCPGAGRPGRGRGPFSPEDHRQRRRPAGPVRLPRPAGPHPPERLARVGCRDLRCRAGRRHASPHG